MFNHWVRSDSFWDSIDCRLPGSSIHVIFQAKILAWVAVSSSRGSSWPRDRAHVSCIGRWVLYHWATGEPFLLMNWTNFQVSTTYLSLFPLYPVLSLPVLLSAWGGWPVETSSMSSVALRRLAFGFGNREPQQEVRGRGEGKGRIPLGSGVIPLKTAALVMAALSPGSGNCFLSLSLQA